MITMSNLPPIDVGDEVVVYSQLREHMSSGPVIKIDDGGIVIGDSYPYWVPWSAVGWVTLSNCARAQQLVNDYRRDHPGERS